MAVYFVSVRIVGYHVSVCSYLIFDISDSNEHIFASKRSSVERGSLRIKFSSCEKKRRKEKK